MTQILQHKSILLIISGGIAAYKSLELIRLFKKSGADVRCVLTQSGEQFVTPLSVSALCENPVYNDLWSLKDESEMGHIRLSREADLILIAPASANIMAKMAHGIADNLATTTLLANADTPVMIAPAMNYAMWDNPATQSNVATLTARGMHILTPDDGAMACGEFGTGRMQEPAAIFDAACALLQNSSAKPLAGVSALVTSGPTFEPIDPVRFIGNRSSGKQGHAIAAALRDSGADVTLVSGPVSIPTPHGVHTIQVETAQEMLSACEAALPTDIAVCAAAVGDWAPAMAENKIKKDHNNAPPSITLNENPDILKTIATHQNRPKIVVGFAAETQNLIANASAKLAKKSCDFILANDVSTQSDGQKTFGADENHVYLISHNKNQDIEHHDWGRASKAAIASKLVETIINRIKDTSK